MNDTKNLYVVVSRTNTKIGLLIRKVTRHSYNHVSLAIDEDLNEIYSFARYRINTSLVGGFIRESLLRYYRGVDSFNLKIYKLDVSKKQYERVIAKLADIKDHRQLYIYDTLEALGVRRNKCKTRYKMYTCISFITSILEEAEILHEVSRVRTIKKLENKLIGYPVHIKKITKDDMHKYQWFEDEFEIKDGVIEGMKKTLCHFKKMIS